MKHLILTGFMGSGKTTVGKILASRLSLPFVDLDDAFIQQTGLSPQFYIPRFKEPAFRRLEKIYLQRALTDPPSVLSTGGGSVLDPWNRRRMLEKGYVVWLKSPPRILWQRLLQTRNRPLLPRKLRFHWFKNFYQRRLPFYRACHFRCSAGASPPETVAISILKHYKAHPCIRSF